MSKKDFSSLFSVFISQLITAIHEVGISDADIHAYVKAKGKFPVDKIATVLAEEIRRVVDTPTVGKLLTTVKLGQYKTVDTLCAAIRRNTRKDYTLDAYQVLEKSIMSDMEIDLDLYEVTNAELAFDKAVSDTESFKRALELGFLLIPAEAMALARINVNDGKHRLAGMKPIAISDGLLRMLYLGSDGFEFGLDVLRYRPDCLRSPDHVWVFAHPRRK